MRSSLLANKIFKMLVMIDNEPEHSYFLLTQTIRWKHEVFLPSFFSCKQDVRVVVYQVI